MDHSATVANIPRFTNASSNTVRSTSSRIIIAAHALFTGAAHFTLAHKCFTSLYIFCISFLPSPFFLYSSQKCVCACDDGA